MGMEQVHNAGKFQGPVIWLSGENKVLY
jgi:hypothetical protein